MGHFSMPIDIMPIDILDSSDYESAVRLAGIETDNIMYPERMSHPVTQPVTPDEIQALRSQFSVFA